MDRDGHAIDSIQIDLGNDSLFVLNIIIALIMFGVALDLKPEDFRRIVKDPKGPAIGLVAQFLILPAVTFFLIMGLKTLHGIVPFPGFRPHPSIALGLIMIASCPGGNFSNFLAYLAKGNTALSVSMTAVSTFAALVMTPFNLSFWGGMNPDTAALMAKVHMDPVQVTALIFMLVVIPVAAGMLLRAKKPALAFALQVYFKRGSIVVFLLFVVALVFKHLDIFLGYMHLAVAAVIIHNFTALAFGYGMARAAKLPERDCRAICLEVGIQNSALGLTLIFTFFNGLGGMAIVAALWGTWHLISGLSLAFFWSGRPPLEDIQPEGAPA